jgi:ribose 5-phosphate isomerase A
MSTIYERALDFIQPNFTVGLGSGRASNAFIESLGQRFKAGQLPVKGVPTSEASAKLATSYGIPLVSLEEGMPLDVAVDGADEVDPHLNMIKGWGRALVREKVVEAASKKLVILVGKDKLVPAIGTKNKLPVEVVPLAKPLAVVRLRELGVEPVLWTDPPGGGGKPMLTDNGNYILDCQNLTAALRDPAAFEAKVLAIPGVLGTGLFLNMADVVLIGDQDHNFSFLEEKRRQTP